MKRIHIVNNNNMSYIFLFISGYVYDGIFNCWEESDLKLNQLHITNKIKFLGMDSSWNYV